MIKNLYLVDSEEQRPTNNHFEYLRRGLDNIPIEIINDVELYKDLITKMTDDLKFSVEEQMLIWRILATILHLGNLTFNSDNYNQTTSKS